MKNRRTLSLAAFAFFSLCASLLAGEWSIIKPQADESFFSYAGIDTEGSAPDDTDIVIKIGREVNNVWAAGATKSLRSSPLDGSWFWTFSAPPTPGWTIADNWEVRLYDDGEELGEPEKISDYNIISDEA